MTDRGALFRQEAIEFHTRGGERPRVLRIAAPWVRWLYLAVVVLLAAGLWLALTIRVDERVSGPALVDPEELSFVAVLPAAVGLEFEAGQTVRIEVADPAVPDLTARLLHSEAADAERARWAGFDVFPEPAVLIGGFLAADLSGVVGDAAAPEVLEGRAQVVLRSNRLLSVLVRGISQRGAG